jgi:hypothetical protein
VCRATQNLHACTHACVLLNSENNYICTFTGIVFSGATQLPAAYHPAAPKPTRAVGAARGRIVKWARAAVIAYLTSTPKRVALVEASISRAAIVTRREMGNLPWSARQLARINASTKRRSSPMYTDEYHSITTALISYYTAFASTLFRPTRSGVSTYVAVMLDAMATGIKDVTGTWIIYKNPLVARHAPAPIDYPKLSVGMATCKSMSTGSFALRCAACTPAGIARKNALFRP